MSWVCLLGVSLVLWGACGGVIAAALRSSGLERVRVRHRPRLLSDNGPSYLSAQLGSWLAEHGMAHTVASPITL